MILTTTQKFAQARLACSESAETVASDIGYSRPYLYRVLKNPDQNKKIYKQICEYIKNADIEIIVNQGGVNE